MRNDAEAVITSKLTEDFGRAARHPELGAAQARFGPVTVTALAALPRSAAYNKARGFRHQDDQPGGGEPGGGEPGGGEPGGGEPGRGEPGGGEPGGGEPRGGEPRAGDPGAGQRGVGARRGGDDQDGDRLAAVRAFFYRAGVPPAVEVWAGDASAALGYRLARAGFYAAEVSATLAAMPGRAVPARDPDLKAPGPDVPGLEPEVRELAAGDDDAVYLDTLFDGYELGAAQARLHRMMMAVEHRSPRLRRYLAYLDGRPAAAGALYVAGRQCYLAGAATIPALRGRGGQSALIRRRLQDAAAVADQVVVTTAFGSPSQANLERLGFAMVHTRALWRVLDEPGP
jgi:hypothetical protein